MLPAGHLLRQWDCGSALILHGWLGKKGLNMSCLCHCGFQTSNKKKFFKILMLNIFFICVQVYSWPFLQWQVKSRHTKHFDKYSQKQHPNLHSLLVHRHILSSAISTNIKASHFKEMNPTWRKKNVFLSLSPWADVGKHSPSQVIFSQITLELHLVGRGDDLADWTQSLSSTPSSLKHIIPVRFHRVIDDLCSVTELTYGMQSEHT